MPVLRTNELEVNVNEQDLAIAVTHLSGGMTWSTPGPGVQLRVYYQPEEKCQWFSSTGDTDRTDWNGSPLNDCRINRVALSPTRGEWHLEFFSIELAFNVVIELQGNRLTAEIPESSWDLHGELFFEVQDVDLFPLFGAQMRGGDGYLMLPHGGGTLRYFRDHPKRLEAMREARRYASRNDEAHARGDWVNLDEPQSYASIIYGTNSDWRDTIWASLWGTVVADAGYVAWIPLQAGDADTSIVTSSNQGDQQLCAAHARLHYRHHPRDERVSEPRRVVYQFLHRSGLDYNDLAKTYRRHLVEEAGIPTLQQRMHEQPGIEVLTRSALLRPMMAIKRFKNYANPYPAGDGALDVYLSFDDLITECRRKHQAGVERALIQLVGFNLGGHDGAYPDILPVEPKLGGEQGFEQLVQTLKTLGWQTSAHINLRCHARSASSFRYSSVMRDRDGGPMLNQTGPMGEDFHACPYPALTPFAHGQFAAIKQLGIDGGIYFDYVLGVLYRCYDRQHGHATTRRSYLDGVRRYLEAGRECFDWIRCENVMAATLDLAAMSTTLIDQWQWERYMRDSTLRQRGLCDEHVEMLAVIYHGLIVYSLRSTSLASNDPWANVLQNAALGAHPIDESRGWTDAVDRLHALEYQVFCDYGSWLYDQAIDSIQRVGDVTRTAYADGTVVRVNHGDTDVQIDGVDLKSRSFYIQPGSEDRPPLRVEENQAPLGSPLPPCPAGATAIGRAVAGAADVAQRWVFLTQKDESS